MKRWLLILALMATACAMVDERAGRGDSVVREGGAHNQKHKTLDEVSTGFNTERKVTVCLMFGSAAWTMALEQFWDRFSTVVLGGLGSSLCQMFILPVFYPWEVPNWWFLGGHVLLGALAAILTYLYKKAGMALRAGYVILLGVGCTNSLGRLILSFGNLKHRVLEGRWKVIGTEILAVPIWAIVVEVIGILVGVVALGVFRDRIFKLEPDMAAVKTMLFLSGAVTVSVLTDTFYRYHRHCARIQIASVLTVLVLGALRIYFADFP